VPRRWTYVAIALLAAFGCGADESSDGSAQAAPKSEAEPAATSTPAPRRNERPLPAFGGWTLDDQRLEISSLLGKRALVYFFNPEVTSNDPVTRALVEVGKQAAEENFQIVGVSIGSNRDTTKRYVERFGFGFPVIDDSSARIAGQFGLRTPVALLGVDAEGYVTFGMTSFPTDAKAQQLIESQVRMAMRLPEPGAAAGVASKPLAPEFEAKILDKDETFDLASARGKPVLLLFFLHTCPHCHEFLEYAKKAIDEFPADKKPLLVGVELTGRTAEVRETLKKDGLDFFPVLFDDDGKIRDAYGVFGGVPDVVLIDSQGRIASRSQGFAPDTDYPLLRMRLARLAGTPVPMLLRKDGFSGNAACSVCHESQSDTWHLTQHAGAYDTLVRHGSDSDAECISCHVVGFGKPGGYEIAKRQPELEDVGCENCHGRGGPHLSPDFVTAGNYEKACLACHDTKHSLGFEYASFLPKISHAANAQILALPAAERERVLAERGAPRKDLLPTAAKHVGSQACQSCHAAEFETWSTSGHAHAVATLEKKDKQQDESCLKCHTTGFGKAGGFPSGEAAAAHADLARVGCESCHGPGGDHVAPDAPKRGTILSLGDKCDSCVILQICGSCHDQANDPGFEFEVLKKIEATRHGTIEAGTGKPLPAGGKKQASAGDAHGHDHALLERAFAAHDAGVARTEPWSTR
jgi:peroxiredoxin